MLPALFAVTLFVGAALLFLVQPLVGKLLLPLVGGSPGVWNTCMVFFQAVLLAGYLYAHLMKDFGPRTRTVVHLGILTLAILSLPILPGNAWKPENVDSPVTAIVLILLVCVGTPFFVLSTSGPLLQDWFRRTHPNRSPYRLYALSNFGSLAGLLSYPLLVEPFVGLTVQHDLRHMTRAVMEGVAFGLRDGLDLMVEAGLPPPSQIRASGGGTRSPLWRQILANVLNAEIAVVGTEEGAAYGAALLAAVGAGWWATVDEAVGGTVEVEPVARPSSDRQAYEVAHAGFTELYPALSPTFHALGGG